jgi:hypothetical protein
MSRQFAPRSVMPASHGAPTMSPAHTHAAPVASSTNFVPSSMAAPIGHSSHVEEEAPTQSQRILMFSEIKFENLRVKPKTRNPDRQKQNFPVKYIDSKIPGGRNL